MPAIILRYLRLFFGSLSVGNGEFAFTVDATGLQTFPLAYKKGVPLGTQSQWGWHSFGNPNHYKSEEYLKEHDFGRGHKEIYACQFKEDGRQKEAANWYRMNPHRLHLGIVGLELGDDVKIADITDIAQTLDMWNGVINSRFTLKGNSFDVQTVCPSNVGYDFRLHHQPGTYRGETAFPVSHRRSCR